MEYKRIEELTTVVTGGTPSTGKHEYWDGGNIPWLQSGCCQNCDVNSTEKYITQEGYDNSSARIMPANTVMIALTGATAGKVGYLNFEACGNQSITGIFPCNSMNQRYLFYYLLSQREKILTDCVGGAQAHISQGYVKNIKVPVLPLSEQKQIVEVLTKLSTVISMQQNEIKTLDNLVKARFVEMFGTYPDNPFGWNTGKIQDVVSNVRYGSSRPAVEGGKYPYLRMNNITYAGEQDLTDTKRIDVPDSELDKCTVQRGDVLFNRTNSKELVGKTCVYNRDDMMVLAGFVIRVRVNERILPEFLVAFLNMDFSKQMLLGMCKTAIGQANINAKEMQNIGLYIPPIALQEQFVDLKKQTDKSKLLARLFYNSFFNFGHLFNITNRFV